jgi:hypothetical protein
MTRRILHKLVIDEVSLVDKPANRLALIKIAKRDENGDDMTQKFGKAAEADWDEALMAYAVRNKLTKSAATLEFANTIEARDIYKRTLRTPRAENIAKAAAVGNVTAETLAGAAFPNLSPVAAMKSWLQTEEGREFYSDDVAARTRAQQGFS